MIDPDRSAIREGIRQMLTDMSNAEKRGDDAEMLVLAIQIEEKAHELRKHAEDAGL